MALSVIVAEPIQAQLIPDNTLPTPTQIENNSSTQRITGGTEAGNNLFHSFDRFDIPENTIAHFDNPLSIENIITRVTGSTPSQIDGILRANGTANLYLLNPNGISIGETAQLDIGGAFLGSTGDRLLFADGTVFPTNPEVTPPLLTVSVPVGVQLGRDAGAIAVEGTGHNLFFDNTLATVRDNRPDGFAVAPQQSMTLIGGDLTLDGANLTAPYGRITLAALSDGIWHFDRFDALWRGDLLDDRIAYGDVRLRNASSVDVSGGGGGEILVLSDRLFLESGSTLLADTLGSETGRGIVLRSIDSIDIRGLSPDGLFSSGFFAAVGSKASGNGGHVLVETDRLAVVDLSIVGADTFGTGNAGIFTIRAREVETHSSFWSGSSFSTATGNGGQLVFEVDRLSVGEGAQILAFTLGAGDAGNIVIRSNLLEVRDARADGSRLFNSVIAATAESGSRGRGGNISIDTGTLRLVNGGAISTGTSGETPTSTAGVLTVRATEGIELLGTDLSGVPSALTTTTFTDAPGSDLVLEAPQLVVRDGGQVSAGTFGNGSGGRVVLEVSQVDLSGRTPAVPVQGRDFFRDESGMWFPSGIFSGSEGSGIAGDLQVTADLMQASRGAELTVSSRETGGAGNLSIEAERLTLNSGGRLRADSRGELGNVRVRVRDLRLLGNSRISTNALEEATGGNIEIDTETLVALDNSDITATAQQGFGGRVFIEAQGIFGTDFREGLTPSSDITASSDLGSAFSGTVNIETPEAKPDRGLESLSAEPIDVAGLVVERCMALNAGSEFVVTGRGGLPPNPWQMLPSQYLWRDLRLQEDETFIEHPIEIVRDRDEIGTALPVVEAQGWRRNADGSIELVAPQAVPHSTSRWNVTRQACSR